ncbi:testis-expressed protein 11-like [Ptychodera flava]|uniref:testis-expressed protein 11-like n=1 Tax=Ptychodera flava TaxID=63121 RepID=UPI00396A5AC3
MADRSEIFRLIGKLEALVRDFEKDADERKSQKTLDELDNLVGRFSQLDGVITKSDDDITKKIHSTAVALWNISVAKKSSQDFSCPLNAKVRSLACKLTFLASPAASDEQILRRQIMMSLKTARAFLDSNNSSMAENSLALAQQCLEKVQEQVIAAANEGKLQDVGKHKLVLEKDFFKLYCYKAECYVSEDASNHGEAFQLIQKAKELLQRLPKETAFLCMLCYNFGVDSFHWKNYEESVAWLRESFELGKGNDSIGPQNQAKCLRLLANVYLDWNGDQHWQKALNAIGLANSEHSHPAGLFLKVKIFLIGGIDGDRLESAVHDLLHHPDLTVDMALNMLRLTVSSKKYDLTMDGLTQLLDWFENSPEVGKIRLFQLDLLLQKEDDEKAKNIVSCVHEHGQRMDKNVMKRFQSALWEQATKKYELGKFSEALEWFDHSASLFSADDEDNRKALAKLHRNRAACFVGLNNLAEATGAANDAAKYENNNPHTLYLIFKIALLKNDNKIAVDALQKLCMLGKPTSSQNEDIKAGDYTDNYSIHGFISLAAQLAFEKSNREVAVEALQGLVEYSVNDTQILTALRCLIRLKLTRMDTQDDPRNEKSSVLGDIKTAYLKLHSVKEEGLMNGDNIQQESMWFMKIAWNIGLQSVDSSYNMHEFFHYCCKFANLFPVDTENLVKQKTCRLMAAASCLQMAKDVDSAEEKDRSFHLALSHIEECRQICSQLQEQGNISDSNTANQQDTTLILLILYEFEAYARLGRTDKLTTLLDKALSLPFAEPKTFETLAGLAMEPSLKHKSVCTRALKVAIKKLMQMKSPDYNKLSKTFHSLIQLSFEGSGSNTEETWLYYGDVLDIIQNKAKEQYPEMEILWLMTKAWNCGIHQYGSCQYTDAEKWCSLAINLLKHLTTLKSNYETQMSVVYSEILDKLHERCGPQTAVGQNNL